MEIEGQLAWTQAPVAITSSAQRGDTMLELASTRGFHRGDWVRIGFRISKEFGRHLHGELYPAGEDTVGRWFATVARVESVKGAGIELDRSLRVDVRMEWNPRVSVFNPDVEESGFEDFTIKMEGNPKKKHLLEEGFNAIEISRADHCWVRNIEIIDADLGIQLVRSRFCQVERVQIRAKKRTGITGHHAIWIKSSQGCLVSDFEIETKFVHDLSYEGLAHGNVIRRGIGVCLNFDHHRNAPFENLITDVDVGSAGRLWESSGSTHCGPHSAARSTVWNVRYSGSSPRLPGNGHFPLLNIIGVRGY